MFKEKVIHGHPLLFFYSFFVVICSLLWINMLDFFSSEHLKFLRPVGLLLTLQSISMSKLVIEGFTFVGIMSTRLVTLGSIELYQTHDWFPSKPTIYFSCREENRTYLPDVQKTNILYTFKGEESWQVRGNCVFQISQNLLILFSFHLSHKISI